MHKEEQVIGIDLGTSNCCVSISNKGRIEVIVDEYGNRTIPSIVSFYKSIRLVGKNALPLLKNQFNNVKRIIGKKYSELNLSEFDFKIINKDDLPILCLENDDDTKDIKKEYYPEEIIAILLQKLKEYASIYLKKNITKAVITVPAYFRDSQRSATKDAATIAGLEVISIINEPTAAAISYGCHTKSEKKRNILVYDLGGGTLDVSILCVDNGVFHVLAVSGDNNLGGIDFDNKIFEYILNYCKKNKIDIQEKNISLIKKKCEEAKKKLSIHDTVYININDINIMIDREIFEKQCYELFSRCKEPILDSLKKSDVNIKEITDVILVGGSTRIPRIRSMISEIFGENIIKDNVDPDEVVSHGASIHGYCLANPKSSFTENIVLLDVVPLSLGVETLNGIMNVIIESGSIIPLKKTSLFSTSEDNQTSVTIKIYEGDRIMTQDNFLVGIFELQNLKPLPKGVNVIKITFEIDYNGILLVSIHDKQSFQINNITISSLRSSKGRMSEEQIQKLIQEAKDNKENDIQKAKKIGNAYKLRSMCEGILNNKGASETDKEYIKNTLKWLDELSIKNYNEIETKIGIIKNIYSSLILDSSEDTLKNSEEDNSYSGTLETISANDKIDDIKKSLLDLCNDLKEKEGVGQHILDYIDTVYMWIYSEISITYNDCLTRIHELERMTNNNELFYELESLCITLKNSVNSNSINLPSDKLDKLDEYVINMLKWLQEHLNESIDIYNEKIKEVNTFCENL